MHGLLAQGLIFMAARENDPLLKAEAEALLDDLVSNRQAANGSFPSPDGLTYGFHNAEIGVALGLHELLLPGL
jgi:hypothetical protein